jgi:hypothetical protein
MAIFNSSCVEAPNIVFTFGVPAVGVPSPTATYIDPELANANQQQGVRGFVQGAPVYGSVVHEGGECFPMHGQLFWFDHIHIIPASLALGTVLTTQEREYEVFNAYRTQAHTLTAIVKTGVDGITLVGEPDNSPNDILPLQGFKVLVTVSNVGPVTINATIQYVFGGLPTTKTETITGSRVIVMSTPPDAQVQERWSWKTDIIEAASGDEQRISVRDVPRQSWKYKFLRTDEELSFLLNQLWGWHENVWALPLWEDYTQASGPIGIGVTNIPVVDTDMRDFRDGELALIWQDEQNFEAVEIVSHTTTNIVSLQPTLAAWGADSLVLPMQLAKMPKGHSLKNWNVNARELEVIWQTLNNKDFTLIESPTPIFDGGIYRGLPVWDINEDYLITTGSYGEREDKDIEVFGDDLGKFSTMTARDFPRNALTGLRAESFGRAEFWRLRQWLHHLRGRQKAIWVPTGRKDFTIESTQTAPSTELNVNITNYKNLVFDAPDGPRTRRNIEIVYVDGTRDLRRIESTQISVGLREVLTLDAAITQDASVANVDRISFLVKRRLNTDDIVVNHDFYEGEQMTNPFGLVDIYDGE